MEACLIPSPSKCLAFILQFIVVIVNKNVQSNVAKQKISVVIFYINLFFVTPQDYEMFSSLFTGCHSLTLSLCQPASAKAILGISYRDHASVRLPGCATIARAERPAKRLNKSVNIKNAFRICWPS